jgi:hypothetical protein
MKNFIIFFDEKEGTSPLVRLLDNFERISIIHEVGGSWEPFDRHSCGPMPLNSLKTCLNMIFGREPTDFARLNEIYLKTAKKPLKQVKPGVSVGFKMRFVPPAPVLPLTSAFAIWNKSVEEITRRQYRRMMFDLLKSNDVTVFLAVRQDLLRWSLSKYHGDGSGNPGHLQFKLARRKASGLDLEPIHVDCSRLETIIRECRKTHKRKQRLMNALRSEGIAAHPLRYEDFLHSREAYFSRLIGLLGIKVSGSDIQKALSKGLHLRKVHPDTISEFVTNHEEVMERIGSPFSAWT